MKRVVIILFYLAFILAVHSQIKISGTVRNTDNKPLAYVNVGILGTHFGTISYKNGDGVI